MKFSEHVFKIVRTIPIGSVMTYGQVAGMLGNPRQARAVGWVLRTLDIHEEEIPWWRVVNSKGYISINQGKGGTEKERQRDLLIEDGVEVSENMTVELERYLMRPDM